MAIEPSADWPTCDHDGCTGIRLDAGRRCLAHAEDEERVAALQQLSQTGEIDARGVTISDALLRKIFDAAPHDPDGHRTFSAARFDGATFDVAAQLGGATFKDGAGFGGATFKGAAEFGRATFEGGAWFTGATFKSGALFDGARFGGGAWFDGATFEDGAWFKGTRFEDDARFDGAKFEDNAWFDGATFKDDAGFVGTTFKGHALFGGVTFEDYARFVTATFKSGAAFSATFEDYAWWDRATFEGYAWFDGATFKRSAGFSETTFKGSAQFGTATFKDDAQFGTATFKDDAGFDGATFEHGAGFVGTTFEHGARFVGTTFEHDARFDEATFEGDVPVLGPVTVGGTLNLDGAQFALSVRIETDASTLTCRRGRFLGSVRFDVRRALVRLDDTDLSVPSLLTGPPHSGPAVITEQPKLVSLQRANVAGLVLANVDLADCRFIGAHNLEKLRLEPGTVFGLSPAVAGWERRQVIAEESAWRCARARPGRWIPPPWLDSEDQPEVLSAGTVASLYRALRKGREDAKDEPGAADFYYGEMEMRRHAHGQPDSGSRGRVDRGVLTAYWLLSGYGLRAWRALAWYAGITVAFAVAFHLVGFTRPPHPATYWTSLLYAFRSTISLTDNDVVLTAWGQLLQALLRLTGPVLLGLALLALRGRIKR